MKIRRCFRLWFLAAFGAVCLAAVVLGGLIWSQYWFGDVNAASTSALSGKAVLFDGDSIAMGSVANGEGNPGGRWSYANYIEETYDINKTNVSIGGARFYWPNAASDTNCSSGDAQKCVIPNHLTSTIKNTTYDYIVLEGAINDLHSNYYDGDHESYATALRNYFKTVTTNSKWAHAKIGFVIVPKPDYSRKKKYRPAEEKVFWKTIQSICDEYSIEYINFFKQSNSDDYAVPSGFDWDFMDTVVSDANSVGSFDGLHPSKGAHKVLGEYIAKWMVNLPNYKYTVSFDSNGSSLSGATNQSVVHGKKSATPTYTIDANQHFSHWSTTKSGTAYNFNNAVNGDLTLYAVWNVDVKFDGNGGKINGETNKIVSIAGNSKVSNLGNPVRSGYDFKYWSGSSSCGQAFDFNTAISRDKTLYACWEEVPTYTYVLSFDLKGGSGEISAQSCTTTGTSCNVTIPSVVPSYANYTLLGYADTSNATTAKYQPGGSITLSANKTIYAVWADGSVEWQDDNKEYVVGNGDDMVVRINYPMANFVKLMVDGEEVDNSNNDKYKLESGSTIITIYSAYLDTMELGNHIIQAVYDNDVTKEVNFTVSVKNEEDGSVPNSAVAIPDTGSNTGKNEESVNNVVVCALPIIVVILTGGLYIRYRNRVHRKFEW